MIIEIKNIDAPELAVYTHLTEAKLKKDGNLFIAESVNVIEAALHAGCKPVSMLSERRHIDGKASELVSRFTNIPVYTADDSVLASITGYEMHRGMLCAFERPAELSASHVMGCANTLCVLEGLTDTTNLGAIMRSAAAFGVDGVLLYRCCDPLSRRSLRVSTGNALKLPWANVESGWIDLLRENGFTTIAMALTDDSVSLSDPALKACVKRALVFGNEGIGLKPETVAACDYTVKIPMSNGVDSLNVSNAAAVAFWELRQ